MSVTKMVAGVAAASILFGWAVYKIGHPSCRNSCYSQYQDNMEKVKSYCQAQEDLPFGDFHCSVQSATAENILTACYQTCERLP